MPGAKHGVSGEPMIYDCFAFFNELELLELRLNELDGVVDRFVLVEATKTFQGRDKPLYFMKNRHLFDKFASRIIHVVVDDMPMEPGTTPWDRDRFQKNAIARGLKECKPEDIIMVSDVDEIPAPAKVVEAAKMDGWRVFRQRLFYYFFNCVSTEEDAQHLDGPCTWHGTHMLNFRDINRPIEDYRSISIRLTKCYTSRPMKRLYRKIWRYCLCNLSGLKLHLIDEGGWHFSYLGGVERIIQKMESLAHPEFNTPEYKDPQRIMRALETGGDIFGRATRWRIVPLDASFPAYLHANADSYGDFIRLPGGK
jgi:beta-1,4-mannosyl-glycoprotein beta-1,4-N-acetylglucosaminyltransferase